MSWSFWFNVLVAVCALLGAKNDHGETLAAFKALPPGRKKRSKGIKLALLWGIPIISIASLPFTAWDSLSSDKRIKTLQQEVSDLRGERTISPDKRKQFIALLQNSPKGPVRLGVRHPDSETQKYLGDIMSLLKEAGYEVPSAINYSEDNHMLAHGCSIAFIIDRVENAPGCVHDLFFAFQTIGLNPALGTNQPIYHTQNEAVPGSGELIILITEKN